MKMNNISKFKYTLVMIALSICFFSCENNVEEEAGIDIDTSCDPSISFASNVKPIIDNNCISCHGGSQAPDLRTYNGISNNADRIKTQVTTRQMPLGGSLSNDEIEAIKCWIENGALNN